MINNGRKKSRLSLFMVIVFIFSLLLPAFTADNIGEAETIEETGYGSLSGWVIDAEESDLLAEVEFPIENAWVYLFSYYSYDQYEVYSDVSGYFEIVNIPEGYYSLYVSIYGYEYYYSDEILIQEGNNDLGYIELNPIKFGTIKGRVTNEYSNPVVGVYVYSDFINGYGRAYDYTDENGDFYIDDVPVGNRSINFSHDNYFKSSEWNIDLAEGEETDIGELIMWPKDSSAVITPDWATYYKNSVDDLELELDNKGRDFHGIRASHFDHDSFSEVNKHDFDGIEGDYLYFNHVYGMPGDTVSVYFRSSGFDFAGYFYVIGYDPEILQPLNVTNLIPREYHPDYTNPAFEYNLYYTENTVSVIYDGLEEINAENLFSIDFEVVGEYGLESPVFIDSSFEGQETGIWLLDDITYDMIYQNPELLEGSVSIYDFYDLDESNDYYISNGTFYISAEFLDGFDEGYLLLEFLMGGGENPTVIIEVTEGLVYIGDEGLRRAILEALGRDPDDVAESVTIGDLESLEHLSAGGRDIESLYGLEYAVNLRSLYLWENSIDNLEPLASLHNLEKLNLADNLIDDISIADISHLEGLTSLDSLDLSYNQISDTRYLGELTSLNDLQLNNNIYLADITEVSSLTALKSLNLNGTSVKDLSPLSTLENLEKLNLSHSSLDDAIIDTLDFSLLRKLEKLYLNNNNISDISFLKDVNTLTLLNLQRNEIVDIENLSGLSNLSELFLGRNLIKDISALENLTGLKSLSLFHNEISNIEALAELDELDNLYLANNFIDISKESDAMDIIINLAKKGVAVMYYPQVSAGETPIINTDLPINNQDEAPSLRRGYVLGGEQITVSDAIAVLRHVVGLSLLEGDALERAKVSGDDGGVTVKDAVSILRIVVGLSHY